MYFEFLIPILSICFNIIFQILFCKFLIKRGLLKTVYLGFICGLTVFVICEFFAYLSYAADWIPLFLVNLVIYGCLGFVFFTFINMGETARRIRLLRELYEAPDGLTQEQIINRYNSKEIIDIRLKRLLTNGQVALRDDSYFIGNPMMLFFSGLIVFMKLLIVGKKSEFDK